VEAYLDTKLREPALATILAQAGSPRRRYYAPHPAGEGNFLYVTQAVRRSRPDNSIPQAERFPQGLVACTRRSSTGCFRNP